MQTRHFLLSYRPPRIAWTLTLFALTVHLWAPHALHAPMPATGIALGGLGFAIMLRGWWLFRRAGIGICPTDPTESLILHDVYRVTRHPMYLGMVLMLLGLASATGALEFYVSAAVLWVVLDRVFAGFEERKLEARFGERYRRYALEVRRWL